MAKAPKSEEAGAASIVELFNALSLDEQKATLAELHTIHDGGVQAKREELLAQLQALGGVPKPVRSPSKAGDGERKRAAPKPQYRAPNGFEWSGRGAMPKVFKEMGITDKEALEQYRIK